MQVSVVIPTFNRGQSLHRCLKNIPEDVEVVVVDDGSEDSTKEIVRQAEHPHLIYLRQDNKGPAAARNAGIELASGKYIAFTDDDCIPVSPWPWPLIHRLERSGPDVAGVGGKVVSLNNGVISRYYEYHRILEPPDSCSYLVTANCAYHSELIKSVGGFDTRIRQPGGEDPGLSFAIRARGHSLTYNPDAVVIHEFRQNILNFIKTFYRYGKGCALTGNSEDAQSLGVNELMPMPLSYSSIKGELMWRREMYFKDKLSSSERLKFYTLVLTQRLAYNAGWNRGRSRQNKIT